MLQLNSRIIVFALAALVAAAGPATAGNRALAQVIGYSDDARYFAFEEYGEQDGSGFAFSNIYVVDVDADRWVIGTPVRNRAEDYATSIADIRARSLAEVRPRIADLGIDNPADTLALVGDGETDPEAASLTFGLPGFMDPGSLRGRYGLSLEMFPSETAADCSGLMQDTLGFALSISHGGMTYTVHRDDTIPRSRSCPLDYRLYGVFQPFQGQDPSRAVVLVSVYPRGFEGPDRRFIAVPLAAAFEE